MTPMAVTVFVRSGATRKEGKREEPAPSITVDGPLIVLGRGEGCDIRLPDPSVSHRHACIRQRGNDYILIDERSTNGTIVGGVKLGAQVPRLLKQGDLARLGRVWIEIRFDRATSALRSPVSPASATRDLALQLVARALEAQNEPGGPKVVVTEGDDTGKELPLEEPGRVYVVGRGQEADLMLTDGDASRRHVQIVRRADQLLAKDLESKNGAELGGVRLAGDRDSVWKPGQTLRIGKTLLCYQHPAVAALAELERGADERLRDDEEVPPPNPESSTAHTRRDSVRVGVLSQGEDGVGNASANAPPSAADAAAADVDPARQTTNQPAAAEVAPDEERRPARKASRGGDWSGTDLAVVLLALGVLALSALGLFWLFRS